MGKTLSLGLVTIEIRKFRDILKRIFMKSKIIFFGIISVVIGLFMMGMGCTIEPGIVNPVGTLIIRNDTYALPDIITGVTIRKGSASGDIVFDGTVAIEAGQNWSYRLPADSYYVRIRTDLGFPNLSRTVNISENNTSALTYDDNGFN